MQTLAVNNKAAAPTTSATTMDRGMNGLRSEDFFKILVTELRQQDPLQPTKTSDLIGQVSQIRNIELSKNLTDALSQISKQQRTAGASELIGKYVTATFAGTDGATQEVSGVVTGVRFDPDGTAVLELDSGQSIPAASVTRITSPENGQSAATSATTTNSTTTPAATADKTGQTAQAQHPRILPFVSLDGEFHL
jgi:flagellar basal-body rod modification protein FlgD